MELALTTRTKITIKESPTGYRFILDGEEQTANTDQDPEADSCFGSEILREGCTSDFAFYLSSEAFKGVSPCVLSALELIAGRSTGQLAVLSEKTEEMTNYQFFLEGAGRSAREYNPLEKRVALFTSEEKVIDLFNEEAECLGYRKMILGETTSAVSDTDLHLLESGVLKVHIQGCRSYGALTSRCSLYQDTDFFLLVAPLAEVEQLQFTAEQAICLSILFGRDPQAIIESEFGWRVAAPAK